MRKNECAKMSVCCARIDATRLATKLLDVMTECAKMNAQRRMRKNECAKMAAQLCCRRFGLRAWLYRSQHSSNRLYRSRFVCMESVALAFT